MTKLPDFGEMENLLKTPGPFQAPAGLFPGPFPV